MTKERHSHKALNPCGTSQGFAQIIHGCSESQLSRVQTEGNFMQDRPHPRVERFAVMINHLVTPPFHHCDFLCRKCIERVAVQNGRGCKNDSLRRRSDLSKGLSRELP